MAVEVINTSACCHSCKIRFADGAKLEFHIKTFHLKMVACKRCEVFSTLIKARLIQHIRKIHKVEPSSEDLETPDTASGKKKSNDGEQPMKSTPMDEITIDDDDDVISELVDGPDSAKKRPRLSATAGTPTRATPMTYLDANQKLRRASKTPSRPSRSTSGAEDGDSERLLCDFCWFAANTKSELTTHLNEKHPNRMELPEDHQEPSSKVRSVYPEPAFAFNRNLECRMKCTLCPLDTDGQSEMATHFVKVHFAKGKAECCPKCPYLASSAKEMIDHGNSHYEGFSLAQYICGKCDMDTGTPESMEAHWKLKHLVHE